MIMTFFDSLLLAATLLCSLNAGFLLAFSIIVMPAIHTLDNKAFIEAFQKMDAIIQNGQPLFMLMWIGSALCLLLATLIGVFHLSIIKLSLLLLGCIANFIGVQLCTALINIPLNNQLQRLNCQTASNDELSAARHQFEEPWNKWNQRRTIIAIMVAALLLITAWL